MRVLRERSTLDTPAGPIRIGPAAASAAPQGRDHRASVRLDGLFLVAVHEVEVELLHADPLELSQPGDLLGRLADYAEAIDRLVVDEAGVGGADLGVVVVVV